MAHPTQYRPKAFLILAVLGHKTEQSQSLHQPERVHRVRVVSADS